MKKQEQILEELLMLENQEQTTEEIFDRIEISEVERNNLQQVFNIFCENRKYKENEYKWFDQSDIRRVLNQLNVRSIQQQEIDQMIWEVDENLDNRIDEREFHLMYKKCIEDKLHLEPNGLFLLTQFLMYCKKSQIDQSNINYQQINNISNMNDMSYINNNNVNNNSKYQNNQRQIKKYSFQSYIVSEDTYSLIYAWFDRQLNNGSQREKLDQEIKMIFGDKERNADGTDWQIDYMEFVSRVNDNIIQFRREYKEKQKNLAKNNNINANNNSSNNLTNTKNN